MNLFHGFFDQGAMDRTSQIAAFVDLIESEVAAKKGLSGFAIRKAYDTLKSLKPNATFRAIDYLYDDFKTSYHTHHDQPQALAQAWLSLIDQKADHHQSNPLYGVYKLLRPSAESHVQTAIPKIKDLFGQLGQL